MAFFKVQGKDVYYSVYGSGKPLILLNGIMMSTASWKPFIQVFSAQNQLILVDFFDQGQSTKMTGEKYNQKIQVEIVRALLEQLKLEKASVVGISYGGSVALQFATAYPAKVERLCLFNATGKTSDWLNDIGKAWNKAAATGDGASYYYTTIPTIYSPQFYARRIEWMKNREKLLVPVFANRAFTDAMIRLTDSSVDHDVRSTLKDITAPTLIVSSEFDYITPMPEQIYLHEHIPGSELIIIPGCGHASMYEKPLLFASLILGFVNVSETTFAI